MSSNKMAISEIGVTFPDETFGSESRFGVPFTVHWKYDIKSHNMFCLIYF